MNICVYVNEREDFAGGPVIKNLPSNKTLSQEIQSYEGGIHNIVHNVHS